jgi:16S rRNA (uracil1498-N3)-methyltransferase
MHRFFITDQALSAKSVTFPAEQAHQIRSVLRMYTGQEVVVLDNRGWEYQVVLQVVERHCVAGEIVEKRPATNEPDVQITLYQSLLRREKFEWVLQKGTEIGVSRFIPLITRRSLARDPADISPKKEERWRRIITEAAEQSRRGRLPTLETTVTLETAMDRLDGQQLAIMPWEQANGPDLRRVLALPRPRPVALFIGPEGGFAAEEVQYGVSRDVLPVTLGSRILRAETAALVAISLVLFQLGELG